MHPERIFLVRHGESEGNIDHGVYNLKPDYALNLTPRGIEQAIEVGKKLRSMIGEHSVQFYVSPFWRTRHTFECIAGAFLPQKVSVREEPRIREQEWGHLRGLEEGRKVNGDRDTYGPFYYRIPDGESCADVYDRISGFFQTLHRDFEQTNFAKNVVIVTHGMAIRLFLMRWYHWSVEHFEKLENPENCALIEMRMNRGNGFDLVNELTHHKVHHSYQRPLQWPKG